MKTKTKLLLILISLCLSSVATAATPSWISGTIGPSNWAINPPNPGHTDLISFSGPTSLYANSCMARAACGGTPMISIDSTNKIVRLMFQGSVPTQCTLDWNPVIGLQGDFGPLTPGNWYFRGSVPSIAFNIPFTVSSTTIATVHYVDKDAPGPFHNGTSWKWAFTNIQDALDIAIAGDTILVAEGTYKPDEGISVTLGDRTASFQLKNGVSLIGSHAGYGHADPDARDFDTYATVLSGDLLGNDLWGILFTDENSYRVVTATGCISCDPVLDGFVITAGQADGPIPYNMGAGVYIDGTNPMLKNCNITWNVAGFGGGIASLNGASPSILNCKIAGNRAQISGGGLYCYSNNINLVNCLIVGNSAHQAEYVGGSAIYNLGGSLMVSNCTIMDNINDKVITSFVWEFPASNYLNFNNCIIYNNGNEILTNHPDTTSVNYSCIQGGWPGTGIGNIFTNPLVISLGLWDPEGQYHPGDFHTQASSPCINQGNNSLLPSDEGDLDEDGNTSEPLPVDLDGDPRIQSSTVDMGAYERAGTTPTPGPWEEKGGTGIWFNVPSVSPGYPPVTVMSPPVTLELCLNFQATLRLEATSTSAANGTWTAWFEPDPGIIGPGCVDVTVRVRGENVDIAQLSPGNQQVASLKIFVQPAL